MKIRPFALVAGFAMAAALGIVPAPTAAQEEGQTVHRVIISLDDQGALQYSLNPVIAYHRDRIVFSAPGMDRWSVTFTGETPFADRVISGTGEQERVVPVLPSAALGTYKYDVSVTVDGETITEDPDIIVRGRGGSTPPTR